MVTMVWSMAQVNRYLYYLFKQSSITGFLRYNGFLILYPLGAVAETLVFNNYFERHPDLTNLYYYILRSINGMIIIGVVLLYIYMLKARAKYMNGAGKSLQVEEQSKKEEVKTE